MTEVEKLKFALRRCASALEQLGSEMGSSDNELWYPGDDGGDREDEGFAHQALREACELLERPMALDLG